jgi:hypothetical protein
VWSILTLTQKKKDWAPLGACWLTSLAAKNFYANVCAQYYIRSRLMAGASILRLRCWIITIALHSEIAQVTNHTCIEEGSPCHSFIVVWKSVSKLKKKHEIHTISLQSEKYEYVHTLPSESLNTYVLCHFEIDGNLIANTEVCLNSELCDDLSLSLSLSCPVPS